MKIAQIYFLQKQAIITRIGLKEQSYLIYLRRRIMGTTKKATIEDAWGAIAELAKAQQETDRQLKDTAKQLRESQEETDRQLKDTAKQLRESQEETGQAIKRISGGNGQAIKKNRPPL